MANVFYDNIRTFHQYDISLDEDVFERILKERKRMIDNERFFLQYADPDEIAKFDFNNPSSIWEFRDSDYEFPLMGGCNFLDSDLQKDIRTSGMKLTDVNRRIIGQFDIRNHTLTYSPIFPFFFEERDLIKFASATYFTTLTFDELIKNQIEHCEKFYVHTGYHKTTRDLSKYGYYIFEEISKEKILDFSTNPELGKEVQTQYMKSLKFR